MCWCQDGDRIGLVRKSSGALHYFINGVDQGVAALRAPPVVWGVVDLYGMTAKVTIISALINGSVARAGGGGAREEEEELVLPVTREDITSRVNNLFRQLRDTLDEECLGEH